ncbi:MAG: hypothetical protein ABEJ68_08205 [Halobacteriaceae archaeon]
MSFLAALLRSVQVGALAVAVAFAAIAARGYRGTEWGDVLRPLVPSLAVFFAVVVWGLVGISSDAVLAAATVLWTGAVGGVVLTGVRLSRMVARGAGA